MCMSPPCQNETFPSGGTGASLEVSAIQEMASTEKGPCVNPIEEVISLPLPNLCHIIFC